MFYLFAGHDYYPEGGFDDLKGAFISLDLAIERLNAITNDALGKRDYQSEIQWFQVARIEYDGWSITARGWKRSDCDLSTHRLTDVTCYEDKGKRVMWMPVNGEMK